MSVEDADRLCSFNEKSSHRTARAIRQQCGDAMNIHVMSVLHLHSLMCYRWQVPSALMQSIHIGKRMLQQSIKEATAAANNKRLRLNTKTSRGMLLGQIRSHNRVREQAVPWSAPSTPNQEMNISIPKTMKTMSSSSSSSARAPDPPPSASESRAVDPSVLQSALSAARRKLRSKTAHTT
eukprot:s3436_g4.t1